MADAHRMLVAPGMAGSNPSREATSAVVLALLVTAFDVWMLGGAVVSYFAVDQGIPALVIARKSAGLAGLLVAQAAFFWASCSSPGPIRAAAWLCFTAVTLLQYGFVAAAGGVFNTHDIPMALQSVKYWPTMIREFTDWRALVPSGMFAAALLFHRDTAHAWLRRWALAVALLVIVHGAYARAHFVRLEFGRADAVAPPMASFQSFLRTLALAASDSLEETLRPYHRQEVAHLAATLPIRHVLLVIDESVSAGHLSLEGYDRATTPWLEQLDREGRLTRWAGAASATVYSNSSFLALVTGFNAFPDPAHRVFTLPTIFQFAKAMKYRTHLFDGQMDVRRFGLTTSDMRFVDDWQHATGFGDDPDTDARIGHAVARVLEEPAGQFVLVMKRGNHAPHENNYPKGPGRWPPDDDHHVAADLERVAVTNSYDEALRYNVDAFFRALLQPDGTLPRTVGIYTSDHGEELGGDGVPAMTRKLLPEVVAVPLLMFGDDRPRVDTSYRASHLNVFPTLLDLMNVPLQARPWTYSRSLLVAKATDRDPRPVFVGNMFGGGDYHESKDFDAIVGTPAAAALR